MNSDPSQIPESDRSSQTEQESQQAQEYNLEETDRLLEEVSEHPSSLSSKSENLENFPEDSPELFADAWLDEKPSSNNLEMSEREEELTNLVAELESKKQVLEAEVKALQDNKKLLLQDRTQDLQQAVERMIQEGLKELEERKSNLEVAIEQLERRRERIKEEMRTSFAGVSQDLAIRVQGFKDYLVGSLQDLAAAAEQLELVKSDNWGGSKEAKIPETQSNKGVSPASPQFAEAAFEDQSRRIRKLLDQYRTRPDYYGPPWQLRRTFEPVHAQKLQDWFFTKGGRGAIKTMGSRLQNILIASTAISVMHNLYGDRCRTLVLANSPERLGEWRRGLQDCLGISRSDFGPNRGLVLFEEAEPLVQKAERLVEDKFLPLIIIDETEDQVSLALLQFPLWLAFASEPQPMSSYNY